MSADLYSQDLEAISAAHAEQDKAAMSQPLDYKELLKKYMSVVIGKEGYDFTTREDAEYAAVKLSQQELDELKAISKELGYE